MKKTILLSLAFAVVHSIAVAQQPVFRHCDTDIKWQEAVKRDPEAAQRNARLRERLLTSSRVPVRNGASGTILYRIPIVFHVIHQYGTENISKAQILDAMDILNKSFQKLNSDTGVVIPLFQSIFANCQMEFVLPNLDPDGNCTDGITRTFSPLTAEADDNVKGLIGWPSDRYFNVWVVQNIASGAAGYAYYPGIPASIDGVVIRHDYVGGIGTSNSSNYTERSLTHEVGHWLDLPHTWGSTNFPGVPSNCGTDDGISDTPNTIGVDNFTCNTAQSTCGAIDNVQNYMDYASCHYMFTEGQKARMFSALNSSVGNRDNLSTSANWILTGTEPNRVVQTCVPVADFSIKKRGVCTGASITFKDVSWNAEVTSRVWSFPGGTPSTDTSANPVVVYNTPGVYNVTLTVSSAAGTDQITRTGIVEVLPNPGSNSIPFAEGFETITFPGNEWATDNPNNNNTWILTSLAGATGSKSLRLTNQSGNGPGSVDALITPTLNLSNVSGTMLTFSYAYAAKTNSDSSELRVYYSTNCGDTWSQRFLKKGVSLRTAPNTTGNFIPNATQWVSQSVNLVTGAVSGKPSVRLKFEFTNVNANNIYIDDINLNGNLVGMEEVMEGRYNVSAYPNPARDLLTVSMQLDRPSTVACEVIDLSGRVVFRREAGRVNGAFTTEIPNQGWTGLYMLRLFVNDESFVKRIAFID